MPKEIKDLKVFMKNFTNENILNEQQGDEKISRPQNYFKKRLTIKKNKKFTKFKLRTKKYLLTFKTKDTKIIKKILKLLPPSIPKTEIKSRSDARKVARKN